MQALDRVIYPNSRPAFASYFEDAVAKVEMVMVGVDKCDSFFGVEPAFWEDCMAAWTFDPDT